METELKAQDEIVETESSEVKEATPETESIEIEQIAPEKNGVDDLLFVKLKEELITEIKNYFEPLIINSNKTRGNIVEETVMPIKDDSLISRILDETSWRG
jgi:hypothetical protein